MKEYCSRSEVKENNTRINIAGDPKLKSELDNVTRNIKNGKRVSKQEPIFKLSRNWALPNNFSPIGVHISGEIQ